MKEKYYTFGKKDRNDRFRILTMTPESWSIRRLSLEFNVTYYTAMLAKKLYAEKGFMSIPNPVQPKTIISDAIRNLVKEFYYNDEISRVCPGRKDFVSVKKHGETERIQKRLLLMSVNESFIEFKARYGDVKVGRSSFACLKPPEIIQPNSSGMHRLCVCLYHQNVKLMVIAIQEFGLKITYHDLMQMAMCTNTTEACYNLKCKKCPGSEAISKFLTESLADLWIEQMTYMQWCSQDNHELKSVEQDVGDFIKILADATFELIPHSRAAKQQNAFFNSIKGNLTVGEFCAVLDFSENFSFALQDEVQARYYHRNQATLHVAHVYYAEGEEIKSFSFVGISEVGKHDHTAVHIMVKNLVRHLKSKFDLVSKITYMSDGAPSQYKNRFNFRNLAMHIEDFDVQAEWHFFPSCHGKNACDGVGGTIKRLAYYENLRSDMQNQLKTAEELYNWCKKNIQKINFFFYTQTDYDDIRNELSVRLEGARLIKGTHKYHSFVPKNSNQFIVKYNSNDRKGFNVKV